MNNIVPFIPRAAGGDWTAGERERLSQLAGKLTAEGAHVDSAYGVSDAGDPWCVITDEADEVLIHVARINGQFVIHDAAADAVEAEDTLWSAFERLMGPGWRDHDDDDRVIPLRQAQSLLAVVAALLFVREIAHQDGHTPQDETPTAVHAAGTEIAALTPGAHDTDTAASHPQTSAPEDSSLRRQALAAKAAETPAEGAPQAAAASVPEPSASAPHEAARPMAQAQASPALETGHTLVGGDSGATLVGDAGNDLIIGGKGGDHLIGGGGNDTLIGGGAHEGQIDLLEGGAGDDRLVLGARTVAIGGEGHDTFVAPTVAPPVEPAKPEGQPPAAPTAPVILDFTTGDKLEIAPTATIVSVTQTADVLSGMHQFTSLSRTATPGVNVGIDLDGDGRADTYVLVAGTGVTSLTVTAPKAGSSPIESWDGEHSIVVTGGSHDGGAAGDMLLG